MDENTRAKFEEKVKELLNMAKKKKNVLENKEVLSFFSDETLDADKLDKIYDFLEANKVDVLSDPNLLEALRAHVEALGYPLFTLSAAAHQGTRELVFAVADKLRELPPVAVYAPEYVKRPPKVDMSQPLEITVEDNVYLVEGPWLQRLISNTNFGDYESRNWFDRMLRESGLFDRLEAMGIRDGDLVSMYDLEFEYQR